ncbi:MAG: DedA family protein [Rickettsiales bacterium]|nr:DedA family protein [Rickettsiales bacterium]
MHEIFNSSVNFLINFIDQVGYLGIFIGMFLESTAFPIPSELVMIPAGFAVAEGKMNLALLIIVGVLGNLIGAIFSFYLAEFAGRAVLFRIGKYLFIKPETIIKVEDYFTRHGPISVFIGRMLPGVRHFISLPAGIAKMNFKLFCLYTTFGSLIWTSILVFLGFEIGKNRQLINQYIHIIIILCCVFCALLASLYYFYNRQKALPR